MKGLDCEPEYRRRIRKKAAQDQKNAEAKKREAADKSRVEELAAAIHRIPEQLRHSHDQDSPQDEREHWWNKWGVIGLWAAAAVGVIAVVVASCDSHKQRGIMIGQLEEMKDQRRPWVAVTGVDTIGDGTNSDVNGTLSISNDKTVRLNFVLATEVSGQSPAQRV